MSVAITTGSVENVLVVPVNALLALAGGGYAVEVVNAAGVHRLVPVTLGLFDDAQGLVEVQGSGLRAGQTDRGARVMSVTTSTSQGRAPRARATSAAWCRCWSWRR